MHRFPGAQNCPDYIHSQDSFESFRRHRLDSRETAGDCRIVNQSTYVTERPLRRLEESELIEKYQLLPSSNSTRALNLYFAVS
jgi:hypothetical protein